MKRLALFIFTLLCANVLSAQTEFIVGNLKYKVNSSNPQTVSVGKVDATITTANIPATVAYQGTTYSVTSIGVGAFEYCNSLIDVTIPNSVTSIGNYAFKDCSSLTSITIPNSVTSIGNGAFKTCISLTSVDIPNSVTSIGNVAFYGCISLTSVDIPNSVTSIGENAFYNCRSLTSIDIPNSVTSIGGGVFYGCISLTSVDIPNSVTSIGENAFYNCSSLTSVTIPDGVDSIMNGAFKNCSNLTSINIPNSVNYIARRLSLGTISDGSSPFEGCSSLTSMTIDMRNIVGDSTFFSSGTQFTYESPFNIPSLQNLTLGENVTSIASGAFNGCSSLQNLTLGENVTSIASGAFNDCSFLQNVTCLATTPPTLEDNTVFPYPNIASLNVPCGTLEAYSSATSFWNMFFNGRIEEDCEDDSGIEQAEETLLSFFPNPTKSEITFSQAIEKVEVIDLTGKTILTFTNTKTINIESLPSGAYYLRLTNNDKTIMQKAIKE